MQRHNTPNQAPHTAHSSTFHCTQARLLTHMPLTWHTIPAAVVHGWMYARSHEQKAVHSSRRSHSMDAHSCRPQLPSAALGEPLTPHDLHIRAPIAATQWQPDTYTIVIVEYYVLQHGCHLALQQLAAATIARMLTSAINVPAYTHPSTRLPSLHVEGNSSRSCGRSQT